MLRSIVLGIATVTLGPACFAQTPRAAEVADAALTKGVSAPIRRHDDYCFH